MSKTKTIVSGNFKGGVGKTTNAVMIGYTLSQRLDYKVLVIDLDPQGDATKVLMNTMVKVFDKAVSFKKTLEMALEEGNLSSAIMNVSNNLDLLPSYSDLQQYESFLNENFHNDKDKDFYLKSLMKDIDGLYDYVIIDVPPQLNRYTDSAIVLSDYILIILQTQERALRGAETFIDHIQRLHDVYDLDTEIIGLLPVLVKNGNKLDKDILIDAEETFGSHNIFNTQIRQMERLKRFDRVGITNNSSDFHDKKVHGVYLELTEELLSRIKTIEEGTE